VTDVTIVICTYNNADLLEVTLQSIAAQRVSGDVQWATLVVQNNCTDDTDAVVQRFIQQGGIPNLSTVNESEQGLAPARRRGVMETRSDVLAFVDDDCILAEDWVQNVWAFCKDRPRLGALNGIVEPRWVEPPNALAERCQSGYALINHGTEAFAFPDYGGVKMVGAGLVLSRRALLDSGWTDRLMLSDRKGKVLSAGGDTEMVLRIRNAGYELWYEPSIRIQHIIPPGRLKGEYLCKLFAGFARSDTALRALEDRLTEVTLGWRLQRLLKRAAHWARRLIAYAVYDVVLKRKWMTYRRVQVYEGWGGLVGSWTFLWNGPQMLQSLSETAEPARTK